MPLMLWYLLNQYPVGDGEKIWWIWSVVSNNQTSNIYSTFGITYTDIIWHNNRNVLQYYTFHWHRQHAFIFFLQIFSCYFIPAVFQMLRSHIWKPPLWSFLPLYSSFLTKILSASVLKSYPGVIMSNRKQLRWLPNYVYVFRTPQWDNVFEMKEYWDNGIGNTFTFPVW